MQIDLRHGDCVEVMKTLADASVDAVVTDPPYELGFMGKGWDASGIAYRTDMWREVLRVLKPGGHVLAFGGTRTYHRMAVAIEDAGFEIRDSLHWIYGSGFPKSLNVAKALDKAGAPEAQAWDGWGTALKPAHEPIVVARKPLAGTVAENVLAYGTGGLNVDGTRIATTDNLNGGAYSGGVREAWGTATGMLGADASRLAPEKFSQPAGRWPPNILLTHTPECGETCAEDCSVAEMDRQSGTLKSGNRKAGEYVTQGYMGAKINLMPEIHGDSGSASRFFPVFRYQAKASRSEREQGCEALPVLVARSGMGGTMPLDDRGNERDRFSVQARNIHPTVKPVALMRWLVRLVTPPSGVVLEPFMGSGTTGVACVQEGFGFVGIEREAEYFEICKARIAAAQAESPAQKELFSA